MTIKNFFMKIDERNIFNQYPPLKKYRELIIYGIIGGFSASLDFCIFSLLTNVFSMHYLIANIISVTIGICNSFYFNRKFNFKVKDKTYKRLVLFYVIGISGLLLSSFLLWLFSNYLILNAIVAKLITIPAVTILQFTMNKYISFRETVLN